MYFSGYGDVAIRQSSRAQLFATLDTERRNLAGIDNWIQYAFAGTSRRR